jgi:hypothetical protein
MRKIIVLLPHVLRVAADENEFDRGYRMGMEQYEYDLLSINKDIMFIKQNDFEQKIIDLDKAELDTSAPKDEG